MTCTQRVCTGWLGHTPLLMEMGAEDELSNSTVPFMSSWNEDVTFSNFCGKPISLKSFKEAPPAHKVKRLHKIYEGDKQGLLLFLGLLLQLSQCEKHVNGRPLCSEATLQLRVDTFGKLLQFLQSNAGECLNQDTQQRNPTVGTVNGRLCDNILS